MDLDGAGWAALGTAVGGGLTAAGAWLRSWKQDEHARQLADRDAELKELKEKTETQNNARREAMTELYRVLDLRAAEITRLDGKVDRALADLAVEKEHRAACEVRAGRQEERIRSLEDALTAKGIPFRPWQPAGEVEPHGPDGGEGGEQP